MPTPRLDVLTDTEQQSIRNVDRLLPSQPVMRKLFDGDDEAFHRQLEGLLLSILPRTSVEQKWNLELKAGVSYASLGSDIGTLNFYQLLIQIGGWRQVLELGTYIGVSTLYLAEAVGPHGNVTTVERGEEFHAIARRNFERNGLASRIHAVLGGAVEVLQQEAARNRLFDMVLIDAAKEDYATMLPLGLLCLAPGGLLIVDDVFMNGDALNDLPSSDKGLGVKRMLKAVGELGTDFTRVTLPIGNGTLLIRKPR